MKLSGAINASVGTCLFSAPHPTNFVKKVDNMDELPTIVVDRPT